MARRSRRKRTSGRSDLYRFATIRQIWASQFVRRGLRLSAWATLIGVAVTGVAVGATRTERYVHRSLDRSIERSVLQFSNLPTVLETMARDDLLASVNDLLEKPWTDPELCRELVERLTANGWIRHVTAVNRTGDGRLTVDAQYRIPVAMVYRDDGFMLVDAGSVRLPGVYLYEESWTVIQGVDEPPPPPGLSWLGEDVSGGVAIVNLLSREPFMHQITAVLVDNVGGRVDPHLARIELVTDRPGGRIRWGSAPGSEIAENSAAEKLAILRENYRKTGRADADRLIIEIFTFPDRFTIPG